MTAICVYILTISVCSINPIRLHKILDILYILYKYWRGRAERTAFAAAPQKYPGLYLRAMMGGCEYRVATQSKGYFFESSGAGNHHSFRFQAAPNLLSPFHWGPRASPAKRGAEKDWSGRSPRRRQGHSRAKLLPARYSLGLRAWATPIWPPPWALW